MGGTLVENPVPLVGTVVKNHRGAADRVSGPLSVWSGRVMLFVKGGTWWGVVDVVDLLLLCPVTDGGPGSLLDAPRRDLPAGYTTHRLRFPPLC